MPGPSDDFHAAFAQLLDQAIVVKDDVLLWVHGLRFSLKTLQDSPESVNQDPEMGTLPFFLLPGTPKE
jgi:hypothetical protein